jgi:hypothetical protein
MSIPPLKYAPSSITIPAVFTFPTRCAPLRRMTRSDASRFPLYGHRQVFSQRFA